VGQTNHGRLGREELEREVIGAIGQRGDLIRDPLHGDMGTGVVGEGEESWRGVIRKCANVQRQWRESAGGASRSGPGSPRSHILGSCQRTMHKNCLVLSFA
jgi:hypothetical protein